MSAMTKTISIYGLIDPRTNECRYVGKAKDLAVRAHQHLRASQLKRKTHLNHWIKSLLKDGHKPIAFVLDEVPEHEWQDAEKFWIEYLRFLGVRLTNGTAGGEGGNIGVEGHRKQAAALRGRKRNISDSHRRKIAETNRARAKNPTWLAKISIAAKLRCNRSPEEANRRIAIAKAAPRIRKYKTVCASCDTEFESQSPTKRYCTKLCQRKAWRCGLRVEYA